MVAVRSHESLNFDLLLDFITHHEKYWDAVFTQAPKSQNLFIKIILKKKSEIWTELLESLEVPYDSLYSNQNTVKTILPKKQIDQSCLDASGLLRTFELHFLYSFKISTEKKWTAFTFIQWHAYPHVYNYFPAFNTILILAQKMK